MSDSDNGPGCFGFLVMLCVVCVAEVFFLRALADIDDLKERVKKLERPACIADSVATPPFKPCAP